MNPRRFVAPIVVTAAVAGGGVAGALLGVPGLSGAQETTTTLHPGPGARFDRGPSAAAAEALGIEPRALLEALRDGKTIAEVAGEQGVDVDAVIDAMVADALEKRPGADEAQVRERVTSIANEGMPEGRGGHRFGDRGRGHLGHGPGLDAAAEALGVERSALVEALRDGKTIAQVAGEQGVDVDAVIDAMVAEARERITEFVNEGPRMRRGPGAETGADTEDAAA